MAAFITSSNWRLTINGVDISPMVEFPVSIEPEDRVGVAVSPPSAVTFTVTLGPPRFADGAPFDLSPDDCWRCDAAPSVDALGLCDDCRGDLTA